MVQRQSAQVKRLQQLHLTQTAIRRSWRRCQDGLGAAGKSVSVCRPTSSAAYSVSTQPLC